MSRGSHRDRARRAAGEHVPESFSTYLRREIHRVEHDVLTRRKL